MALGAILFMLGNFLLVRNNTFMKSSKDKKFYGSTTLGEKGQVVIPKEARKEMKLKKGEKLLVFGKGCDMLALAKIDHMQKFAEELSKRLESIRKVIKKSK